MLSKKKKKSFFVDMPSDFSVNNFLHYPQFIQVPADSDASEFIFTWIKM